ncbi:hypothetical protein HZS_4950 [Henneguya salminicola]|nr:hypothetical protein HZS_4950 [Henneguya salminicola]
MGIRSLSFFLILQFLSIKPIFTKLVCPKISEGLNKTQTELVDISFRLVHSRIPSIESSLLENLGYRFSVCEDTYDFNGEDLNVIYLNSFVNIFNSYSEVNEKEIIIYYPIKSELKNICPHTKNVIINLKCPIGRDYINDAVFYGQEDCDLLFTIYEAQVCFMKVSKENRDDGTKQINATKIRRKILMLAYLMIIAIFVLILVIILYFVATTKIAVLCSRNRSWNTDEDIPLDIISFDTDVKTDKSEITDNKNKEEQISFENKEQGGNNKKNSNISKSEKDNGNNLGAKNSQQPDVPAYTANDIESTNQTEHSKNNFSKPEEKLEERTENKNNEPKKLILEINTTLASSPESFHAEIGDTESKNTLIDETGLINSINSTEKPLNPDISDNPTYTEDPKINISTGIQSKKDEVEILIKIDD